MDSASECLLVQRETADLAELPGPKKGLTVITTGGDQKYYPKEMCYISDCFQQRQKQEVALGSVLIC